MAPRPGGRFATVPEIAVATLHGAEVGSRVRRECTTAEALAAAGGSCDVVLDTEVVEQAADLAGFVHACDTLVAAGGLHVLATINRVAKFFLFAIVGAQYLLRWLPRGTHQCRRFPTPAELESLLGADDLVVTARRGVRVGPVTRGISPTDSSAVNYMLVAARRGEAG